jgi:subtilase family serine protease
VLRVAYGIQPLLERGIDGRGEAVTVVAAPPVSGPAGQPPPTTDIRADLAAFDRVFRLPAARVQMVTGLAGSASSWQVTPEEVQDAEIVHMVAPAATLRVVLLPANVLASASTATATMLAALRLAVSGTGVASIGFSLGEHFFTKDAHHNLGFVNPAIYFIAASPSYHTAFHDITTGSNKLAMPYPAGTAGYHAGPGWDPVTGWGTPNA